VPIKWPSGLLSQPSSQKRDAKSSLLLTLSPSNELLPSLQVGVDESIFSHPSSRAAALSHGSAEAMGALPSLRGAASAFTLAEAARAAARGASDAHPKLKFLSALLLERGRAGLQADGGVTRRKEATPAMSVLKDQKGLNTLTASQLPFGGEDGSESKKLSKIFHPLCILLAGQRQPTSSRLRMRTYSPLTRILPSWQGGGFSLPKNRSLPKAHSRAAWHGCCSP